MGLIKQFGIYLMLMLAIARYLSYPGSVEPLGRGIH